MMKTTRGMADMPMDMNAPTFTLSEKDFPATKGWTVGKKYSLSIEVENVGMNKNEYMEKSPITTRLKIVSMAEDDVDETEMASKMGRV